MGVSSRRYEIFEVRLHKVLLANKARRKIQSVHGIHGSRNGVAVLQLAANGSLLRASDCAGLPQQMPTRAVRRPGAHAQQDRPWQHLHMFHGRPAHVWNGRHSRALRRLRAESTREAWHRRQPQEMCFGPRPTVIRGALRRQSRPARGSRKDQGRSRNANAQRQARNTKTIGHGGIPSSLYEGLRGQHGPPDEHTKARQQLRRLGASAGKRSRMDQTPAFEAARVGVSGLVQAIHRENRCIRPGARLYTLTRAQRRQTTDRVFLAENRRSRAQLRRQKPGVFGGALGHHEMPRIHSGVALHPRNGPSQLAVLEPSHSRTPTYLQLRASTVGTELHAQARAWTVPLRRRLSQSQSAAGRSTRRRSRRVRFSR